MAERITVTFDVSQAQRFAGQMGERAAPTTREECEAAMLEAVLLLEREIKEATPVGATALLRQSWTSQVSSGESATEVTGLVYSPLPYAAPVEFGTRPHWPPLDPIIDWVRAKLDIKRDDDAEQVARLIQVKIASRGTKGQNMVGRQLERLTPQLEAILVAGVRRITRRLEKGL